MKNSLSALQRAHLRIDHMHDSYVILADGKALKTPAGNLIKTPSQKLAVNIIKELKEGELSDGKTADFFCLLITAIDKGQPGSLDRVALEEAVLPYIDGDLLVYTIGEPEALAQLNDERRGTALALFEQKTGLSSVTTSGLGHIAQNASWHGFFHDFIARLDPVRFTAFHTLVSLTGSPVTAWLALKGLLDARAVSRIVNVEDDYHAMMVNDPPPGERDDGLYRDIAACLCFADFNASS